MKKLMFVLSVILAISFFGCVYSQPKSIPINLHISSPEGTEVESTNNEIESSDIEKIPDYEKFDNPYLQFSDSSKIHDGILYTTINIGTYSNNCYSVWKDFQLVRLLEIKHIVIYLFSGGGNGFTGMALVDEIESLKKDKVEVEIQARGLIASAAVPVFLVGTKGKRFASKNTSFMLHPAALFKGGFVIEKEKFEDLQAQSEMILLTRNMYLNILVNNSNITKERANELMRSENWFGVDKAKEMGFVDEIK